MKKTLIYTTIFLGALAVSCQNQSNEPALVKVASVEGITIATIDTDTIYANFDMVTDMMAELAAAERRFTDDLQQQGRNLQRDFENWESEHQNYLRVLSHSLTRSDQERREQEFTRRAEQIQRRGEQLQQLEQRYMQQLMELNALKNQEVQDHIFAFIEKFNKDNGNFTLILSRSRGSGVLYALPSMDITDPVLAGLNAEYAQNRRGRR